MHALHIIRKFSLIGALSLTFVACGGGGGGGGGSDTSDDSYTSDSSAGNTNNTDVSASSPSGLSVGQKVSLSISGTAVANTSATFSYTVASLSNTAGTNGKLTDGSTFEYKKTGSNTAEFKYYAAGWSGSAMTALSSFVYTLQFSDNLSGNITRYYAYTSASGTDIKYNVGTFRITGSTTSGGSSTSSGSSSSGSSSSGSSSSGSSSSGSSSSGSSSSGSSSSGSSSSGSSSSGSSSSGSSSSGSSSSGSSSTIVIGNAPTSLDGYYIYFNSTINNISKIGFTAKTVNIQPANITGTYSYTKSGASEGKLSISCSESRYSGNNITLTFPTSGNVVFSGKLGNSTYTLSGFIAKGSVPGSTNDNSSSGNTSGDDDISSGYAPSAINDGSIVLQQNGKYVFRFNLDSTGGMSVTHYFSDEFWSQLTPDGSYTYTKTGDNTGKLKATHKYITRLDLENKKYYTSTSTFTYVITFISRSDKSASGTVTCQENGEKYDFKWSY